MSAPSGSKKRIFVSYAREDGEAVIPQLPNALVAAGHEPVGDWDLRAGDEWAVRLNQLLNEADGGIIVVGPGALRSDYVAEETANMFARVSERPGFRFAVLLLPSVDMGELRKGPLRRLADTYVSLAPTLEGRIAEVVVAFASTASEEVQPGTLVIEDDTTTFTMVRRIEVGAPVSAIAVGELSGESVVIAAAENAEVRMWDPTTGKARILIPPDPHEGPVWGIALADPVVVSVGNANDVWAWGLESTRRLKMTGHTGPVNSVATGVLAGRAIAVSAGDDHVLRVWDLTTGDELAVLTGHTHWVNGVALGTVEGTVVAVSASTDQTVRVRDLTTFKEVLACTGHEDSVSSVAFGTAGGRPVAASGSLDRTILVWDLTTGAQIALLTGHSDSVRSVAITTVDDREVVVSGANDHTVRLWNIITGEQLGPPITGHTAPVRTVAVGDLGGVQALFSGSDDGTVRSWVTVGGDRVEWLSDSTSKSDYLKRRPLALVLAQRLQRQHEKEPNTSFLIHIDGPWGAGKSTLLDYLRSELDDMNWVPVDFNAWREAGVGPPWWALLAALRSGISQDRRFLSRVRLRTTESFARLWRSGASFVLAFALLLAISTAVFLLLRPSDLTAKSISELARMVTAILAALGTLGAGALVAARLLLWDSARGARLFEQSNAHPMQDVARHFHWLMGKAHRPVVFLIDDLDRCPQAYVVELLDAIQTLIRGKGTKLGTKAASFVIAADGAWIRTSYEIEYEKFMPTIAEPGRPLGYLFLDKLFQLHVPMPTIDPPKQQAYLGHLLGLRSSEQIVHEEMTVRAKLRRSTSEAQIVETLQQASAEVRDRVADTAIKKLSAPEVAAATEHRLQRFGPLLSPNPRSMKLFLNTYIVLRTVRTLEGNPVPVAWLALWTIIETRWPSLADHFRVHPEHITLVGKPVNQLITVPESLRMLFTDPAVRWLTTFEAGSPPTPDAGPRQDRSMLSARSGK